MAISVSAAVRCARRAEIVWRPKVTYECHSLVVLSVPIRAIRGQPIQIRRENHGWREWARIPATMRMGGFLPDIISGQPHDSPTSNQ